MNGIFIGIITGLDNFAVSAGFGTNRLSRRALLVLVAGFAAFETLMPLVGFALASAAPLAVIDELGPLLLIGAGALVLWRIWRGAPQVTSALALIGVPLLMSLDNLAAGAAMQGLGGFSVVQTALAGLIAAVISLAGLALGRIIGPRLELRGLVVPQIALALCLIAVGGAELAGA